MNGNRLVLACGLLLCLVGISCEKTQTAVRPELKLSFETIKTQTVTCSGGITVPAATLASTTNITAGTITTVTTVTGLTASNLDTTVSSRLAAGSYTAPSNLTAAQIATGVWQDATAGDFTAANSIGKSIMNGVSLGTGLTVNAVTGLTASNLDATISSRLAASSYTVPLDAAGTRSAIGLATANLDTQLTPLASLTFTVPAKLDVNCLYVNGVQVTGAGTSLNPWGPA